MLTDEVQITVKGGHGGAGCVSFYKKMWAGPDGGDGGKGGDLYAQATSDIYALSRYQSHNVCEAPDGERGASNQRSGANGKNLTIIVPVGTVFIDKTSGEEIELLQVDERKLLAKGGLGGRGNMSFKSSRNTTPKFAQPGLDGDVKEFDVKLKLIADFGLIGLPNAGKSSLLNQLTNATAKIGDYPFTTLEPNLGVLDGKVIADIPGLIEGASEGKGLGDKFLKHIEKVHLLLHCISAESDNLYRDYQVVHEELKRFNPKLLEKTEIILITKSDLVDAKELKDKFKELKKTKKQILTVSVHDWDSLQQLIKVLQTS